MLINILQLCTDTVYKYMGSSLLMQTSCHEYDHRLDDVNKLVVTFKRH